MSDAVIHSQEYAVLIERSMSAVFDCDRCGVGGLVSSDYIRKHPYAAMCCTLTAVYVVNPSKKEAIETFIKDNMFYSDWSIDELLSFDTNTKVINGIECTLESENGEAALQSIIKKFGALIK